MIVEGDVIEVVDSATRFPDGTTDTKWALGRVSMAFNHLHGRRLVVVILGQSLFGPHRSVEQADEGKTWREAPLLDRLAGV